jgi:hypothetical protein
MSMEYLKLMRDFGDTPLASQDNYYSRSFDSTASNSDQYAERVKSSEITLNQLKVLSRKLSKEHDDLVAIKDQTISDCQTFLADFLKYAELPEIDWENDTGHLNLSWRISSSRFLSVLFRGDGYVIFSGVFDNEEVFEGTPSLARAANAVKGIYATYLNEVNGRAGITTH